MCTVIVRVAPGDVWPVTLLALRDESPDRPWDPPGAWWPSVDPQVHGVHDRSAGGAWLAASDRTRSLAVVLNREALDPASLPAHGIAAESARRVDFSTRGVLPLDAVVTGTVPSGRSTARPFNLLRADADGVQVTAWDGIQVRTSRLGAGVHMLAETAPDDVEVPRIGRWLEAFRSADAPTGPPEHDPLTGEIVVRVDGWASWLGVLAESAGLRPTDPAAILRDHVGPDGRFTTLSVVAAAVGPDGVVMRHSRYAEPGVIDASAVVRHA